MTQFVVVYQSSHCDREFLDIAIYDSVEDAEANLKRLIEGNNVKAPHGRVVDLSNGKVMCRWKVVTARQAVRI